MMAVSTPATIAAAAPPPQKLALFNTALAVAQALIVAYFGYVLTGRLDLALKERQTEVQERQVLAANLEKMEKLLNTVTEPKSSDIERAKAVAQLSMYGRDGLFPLYVTSIGRSEVAPNQALWGMRVLSLQRHDEVCALLVDGLRVPELVHGQRKESVMRLATELRCLPDAAVAESGALASGVGR